MGVMASVFITMPALAVKYPIKTSTNGRYLVDSENKPFFFGEGFYEGEHDGGPRNYSTADYRKQSYWVVLGGGSGGSMGNGKVWSFDTGWQDKLNTPNAKTLGLMPKAFEGRPWFILVPDQEGKFVTAGIGTKGSFEFVVSAYADDGSLGYVYLPPKRVGGVPFSVDLSLLKGNLKATWFDPSDASEKVADGSPFKAEGTKSFTAPSKNTEGATDFLLVLESDVSVSIGETKAAQQKTFSCRELMGQSATASQGLLRGTEERPLVEANGRAVKVLSKRASE